MTKDQVRREMEAQAAREAAARRRMVESARAQARVANEVEHEAPEAGSLHRELGTSTDGRYQVPVWVATWGGERFAHPCEQEVIQWLKVRREAGRINKARGLRAFAFKRTASSIAAQVEQAARTARELGAGGEEFEAALALIRAAQQKVEGLIASLAQLTADGTTAEPPKDDADDDA